MPVLRSILSRAHNPLISFLVAPATLFAFNFPRTEIQSVNQGPVLPAIAVSDMPGLPVPSETGSPKAIEGFVTDSSNKPLASAVVTLSNSSFQARTDANGYFAFSEAALGSLTTGAQGIVQLTVQAAGHSDWTISGATYYKGDTLRVYPRLAGLSVGVVHVTAASVHSLSGVQPKADAISNRLNTSSAVSAYVFSRVAARLTPPATIRVYRTDSDTVEVVPFRDYLKHVLPNEWVPTWSPAALKAGAMAVKSYAWYWVSVGGKQVSLGADVKDNTDDQVYDPNVSYASTDAAVDLPSITRSP